MITRQELETLAKKAERMFSEDTLVSIDGIDTVLWSCVLDCLSWSEYSEGSLGVNGDTVQSISDWIDSFHA
jgi:hypothetical protein